MNFTPPALQPIPLLYNHHQQSSGHTSKKPTKPHVSAACVNCKKAHLACDVSRPCKRCISTDKADSCHDVQHKKRGRPKMMRDSNNKKIRPAKSDHTASNYGVISFSSDSTMNNDTMTILLSMDLCCARVTDQSLEYLQLYPQEFSHRSIYDFLAPGDSQQYMAKVHRCLLDNAVQHQARKVPPDNTVRSSFGGFYSNSMTTLLNIANGSLTLKQKLKFRYGSGKEEQEMDCKLYLGGGFGADLFDSSSLNQLYIVCILAAPQQQSNDIRRTSSPLPLPTNDTALSSLITPVPLTAEKSIIPVSLTSTPMFQLLDNNNGSSNSSSNTPPYSITTEDDEDEEEELTNEGDYYDVGEDDDIILDEKLLAVGIDFSEKDDVSVKSPTSSSTTTTTATEEEKEEENKKTTSLLDRFRQKTTLQRNKQNIHPHELYYLHTTSSRLSSEAIAHTAYPYLSTKLNSNHGSTGSSCLATYNNFHNNK